MICLKELFNIEYPIIQGGMVWVAGANLAAAVSNSGGLGLIGAGSMTLDLLDAHIIKARSMTQNPFGINIPLLYSKSKEQIDLALKHKIKIFFTSAGGPKKYTSYIKSKGGIVVHVTSSPELALKCQNAGVDAIVAEGFEAGAHNGKDEITTMTLIPQVVDIVNIPVIAAGGIACGKQILAAQALGASGVQIGSLFASSSESSAHTNFKNKVIISNSSDTKLYLKEQIPVRLISNHFTKQLEKLSTIEEKLNLLGKNRARNGIHRGDLEEGELEIGQVCGQIKKIQTVQGIFADLIKQYNCARQELKQL